MAKKLLTSPAGIAVWPRVDGAPDTKFDEAGVYSTKIRYTAEEAAPLIEMIDEAMDKALADAKEGRLPKQNNVKPKKTPKMADAPYAVDEDTGDVTINFKMYASGERKDGTKWNRKPALFDAAGKPLVAGTRVGGGSKIKVSFEMSPFWTALVGAGVSLRLEAVQILDLKEFSERDASAYGFAVEEGFTGKEADDSDNDADSSESPFGEDTKDGADNADGDF